MPSSNGIYTKVAMTTFILSCATRCFSDSTYQGTVPNLDGGEGANENILFGTNIEWNTHDAEQLAPTNGQSCDSQVIDNTPATTPKNEDLHENEGIKELHDMAHQDKSTAITEFDS